MSVQCVILGRASARGNELLRAFDGDEEHVDRDIAVCVAVDLDARAVHTFDPFVEGVLRFGDVALVRRLDAGIGLAERHGPLGERPVDRVLRGGAQPDPLVAEAGHDPGGDHRVEDASAGLVADAVQQVAARPHILQRRQIAALVVDAGQPVADELFGDVRQPVATSP